MVRLTWTSVAQFNFFTVISIKLTMDYSKWKGADKSITFLEKVYYINSMWKKLMPFYLISICFTLLLRFYFQNKWQQQWYTHHKNLECTYHKFWEFQGFFQKYMDTALSNIFLYTKYITPVFITLLLEIYVIGNYIRQGELWSGSAKLRAETFK